MAEHKPGTVSGGSLVVAMVASGSQAIQALRFDPGDKVVFGRADADVLLDDKQCSRNHFEITNLDGKCVLKDLKSSNGTMVNGRPVPLVVLRPGDEISAGNSTLRVKGSLTSATPQIMIEVRGVADVLPGLGNSGDSQGKGPPTLMAGRIKDLHRREARTEFVEKRPQSMLPGVWQVCRSVFDDPSAPPKMQRLVEAVVSLGDADRAAVVLIPHGHSGPVVVSKAVRDGYEVELPMLPEIVSGCSTLGAAISIPSIAHDVRYSEAAEGSLPDAGVVYASIGSLERTHGVLYAEWQDTTDFDKHFMWTWSVASQVGLLIDRNALAAELRNVNAKLEETIAERNHDLATALERLSSADEMMEHAGKLAGVGELTAGIVHELNSPLSVILGYADMLSSKHGEDLPGVSDILSQAKRMRRIVTNVSELSRKQGSEPRRTDLRKTMARLRELVAYELKMHGAELVVDLPDDLPAILADSIQLEHVFINLVTNACQAIGRGNQGRVTIEATYGPSTVSLIVTDNGPGLPMSIIRRVFEPFFTTKPAGKGTGLGLAISRRILEDQGATIKAANAPDGGAQFTVRFPRAGAVPSPEKLPAVGVPREGGRPCRVLVVMEDPDVRRMLTTILARASFQAAGADSARNAIHYLETGQFDAVVLDAHDTDAGLNLFEAARESGQDLTGAAIVLATAMPTIEQREAMQGHQARLVHVQEGYSRLVTVVRAVADQRRQSGK